jgi:flagellar M-ring protein FliF
MKNSLQQLGQQLAGIWKQLGMNQRLSVALAGVVVVAGLFLLSYWSSRADYSLLYGKLDDAEAARVVAALDEAKIPYSISKAGGAIHVPADKVHQVRMQLASKGIPRGEGVGFEIFDKANFGISDFVQRANYVRAIQGELARTISQLDEVESARVMVVAPENRLLSANQKQPTASVFVRTRGNSVLPAASVNSIRFLVANAVEGLSANHVTVVDNKGNVLSEDGDDTMAGLSSTQLAARRNVELYLSKKVEGMLEKVLGPGQAVVRVAADINYDTITRIEEKYDPESQVIRTSTLNDENTDTLMPSSTAAPAASANSGADPNNTNTTAAASPQIANSRMRKKVTNSQYEINKITSNVLQGAGSLKRVSAAVFIAAKMEGAGPARKTVPRNNEELEKLRKIVQSALGIQVADPARKDEITLEEMPFNDQFAADLTQQLVQSQRTQVGWDLARHLAYPALAIGVLLFFYRLVRRTPVDQFDLGLPPGPGENGKRNPLDWKQPHQPVVTVEVLNRLIRENPDNMTHALRNWMGRSNTPK